MAQSSHLSNKHFANHPKVLFVSVFVAVLCIGIFFRYFHNVIATNLPFSEAYQPTAIGLICAYLVPLGLGFFCFAQLDKSKIKNPLYFVNLSLLAGLVLAIPILATNLASPQTWLSFDVTSYYIMLFPVLFLSGGALTGIRVRSVESVDKQNRLDYRIAKRDILLCVGFGLILFLLNLYPVLNSRYLVGADVYYHAAMSQHILNGGSLITSPFFKEGANYYYSIDYYLTALLSLVTHVTLNTIWQFCVPTLSALFICFFYLFLRRLNGDWRPAAFGTLLILPFNQLLWADPSLRTFAYVFLMLFLLNTISWIDSRRRIYLMLAVTFFTLTVVSHDEYALHVTGIALAYFVLTRPPVTAFIKSRLLNVVASSRSLSGGLYVPSLDSGNTFAILFLLFSIILTQQIIYGSNTFPNEAMCIVNEVPFSLCQPIGIISILPFLLFPIGLANYVDLRKRTHILLLSIASLFLMTIFYFSHIWSLYHRYFAETAYIGIIAVACLCFYILPYKSKFFWLSITLLLGLSITPKALFIGTYSQDTQILLASEQPTFNLIKQDTAPDSVILSRPSDIINRHIPFYTDRYIFGADDGLSLLSQWQVLSFCNGPYSTDCNRRIALADKFYNSPTTKTLNILKSNYEVDYLLITNTDPILPDITSNKTSFQLVATDSDYTLYKVK